MIEVGNIVRVLVPKSTSHAVGDDLKVLETHPEKGVRLGSDWYSHTDLEVNGPQWVEIQNRQFSKTEAMSIANGCLVRVYECVDGLATESSVFVPNSMIVGNKVMARPTRMQLSESLYVVTSELASISLRANELVLTLRCGKEISVTEDIHAILDKILRES